MSVIRSEPENTGKNTQALLAAIADPSIALVTLFASPTKPDADFAHSDGPDSNLPLLAALTESVDGNLCVYDGLFLTAARRPRYLEGRSQESSATFSQSGGSQLHGHGFFRSFPAERLTWAPIH